MISEQVIERAGILLHALRRRTISRTAQWVRGENDRDRYEVNFAGFSFAVATVDDDGNEPFIFVMYNSSGSAVLAVRTNDDEYPAELRSAVSSLWVEVTQNNDAVIQALDHAISVLDDEPPF